MKYCPRCGTLLAVRPAFGRERQVCPACGFVHFYDPKVATCTIPELDGRIVLVRRAIEPGYGKWTFPGGYMDQGETVEEAALRETQEETGLDVALTGLLGVYSFRDSPVVVIVYRARVLGGALRVMPECLDARAFRPDEIPWEELAFPSTRRALEDLLGRRTAPGSA